MEAQDYKKLVEALRGCAGFIENPSCAKCAYVDSTKCKLEMMTDAADAIEALQADIKRLKEVINELREAQTYIDHYGDKWLTSAKDVPTAAYEHGYADGWGEARAKTEVQDGE